VWGQNDKKFEGYQTDYTVTDWRAAIPVRVVAPKQRRVRGRFKAYTVTDWRATIPVRVVAPKQRRVRSP